MKSVNSFALDVGGSVQYIRHSHLISFNMPVVETDIFCIVESISCYFLDKDLNTIATELPEDYFTLLTSKLVMRKHIKNGKGLDKIYQMANFAYKNLLKEFRNLKIDHDGPFNYYLSKIHQDIYAVYCLFPY